MFNLEEFIPNILIKNILNAWGWAHELVRIKPCSWKNNLELKLPCSIILVFLEKKIVFLNALLYEL